jgi:hypothetical protein
MSGSRDRAGRTPFWERWTTRIVVVIMVVTVIGGGVLANAESVPGYAPWQDGASTLLRHLGFDSALDAYEHWRCTSGPGADEKSSQPCLSAARGR